MKFDDVKPGEEELDPAWQTPRKSITYTDFVSDEPLEIIRANECEYDPTTLSTKRFRALWNEIERLRALSHAALPSEVEGLRAALRKALPHLEENFRWHRDCQSSSAKVNEANAAVEAVRAALEPSHGG